MNDKVHASIDSTRGSNEHVGKWSAALRHSLLNANRTSDVFKPVKRLVQTQLNRNTTMETKVCNFKNEVEYKVCNAIDVELEDADQRVDDSIDNTNPNGDDVLRDDTYGVKGT